MQCFSRLTLFIFSCLSGWFVVSFSSKVLLGGAAYVNSFVTISEETKEEVREFSLGVASVADTLGVCLAGFVSIPVHNKICSMPLQT